MYTDNFFTSPVEDSVINSIKQRAHAGLQKYGTSMAREDLNTIEWLQHLQEELLDASVYIEKLKKEYNREIYNFEPRGIRPYIDLSISQEARKNFEFYNLYRKENEVVGIGKIPFEQIENFPYFENRVQWEATEFFNHLYSDNYDYSLKPDSVNESEIKNTSFDRISRLFILTEYFEKHKKFDDPIFAKRDYLSKKFIVHPGHGRWLIHRLFNEGPYVDSIFWDHLPKSFEVNEEFKNWDNILNCFPGKEVTVELLPHYNTIVPCIYVTRNVNKWHEKMIKNAFDYGEFFLSSYISSNFDIEAYGYRKDRVKNPKRTIVLAVDNPNDTVQTDKAFLASVLGKYQDSKIEVDTR